MADPAELALELELERLIEETPIRCARCQTAWSSHNKGGAITVRVGGFSSPAAAVPVTCPGFAWVDPSGPPVGSYGEPPVPF